MQQTGDVKELTAGLIRIGTFSSVATHWLPSIIREFQKDYPNIEYEFLLGDYREIEAWIREGRVDCGFLCLPVRPDLDTIFLERDDFLAILPAAHPLAQAERIFLDALCKEPFLMLEKDKNAEIADFFRREGLSPNVRFITWDDYAILSIAESGLGVSLLPRLILKRIPYQVAARETVHSFHRDIVLALRDRLAVRRISGISPPSLKIFLRKKALPEHFSDNAFYVMFTESFPKGTGGKTPSPSSPHRELHPCCGCQSFPTVIPHHKYRSLRHSHIHQTVRSAVDIFLLQSLLRSPPHRHPPESGYGRPLWQ